MWLVTVKTAVLEQGLADIVSKSPGSKHFRLCGYIVSVSATHLCYCTVKVARANIWWAWCGPVK